jgi:hypothetical protein
MITNNAFDVSSSRLSQASNSNSFFTPHRSVSQASRSVAARSLANSQSIVPPSPSQASSSVSLRNSSTYRRQVGSNFINRLNNGNEDDIGVQSDTGAQTDASVDTGHGRFVDSDEGEPGDASDGGLVDRRPKAKRGKRNRNIEKENSDLDVIHDGRSIATDSCDDDDDDNAAPNDSDIDMTSSMAGEDADDMALTMIANEMRALRHRSTEELLEFMDEIDWSRVHVSETCIQSIFSLFSFLSFFLSFLHFCWQLLIIS